MQTKRTPVEYAAELVALENDVASYLAAGKIDKPAYEALKYKLERAIEATSEVIAKEHLYGRGGAVPDLGRYTRDENHWYAVVRLVPFRYIRELTTAEKKLAKIKGESLRKHKIFTDIVAYVAQYKQLAVDFLALKEKIVSGVTRQQQKKDKAEQDRKAKFTEYRTLVEVLQQHIDDYVRTAGKLAVEDFDGWIAVMENNCWDLDKVAPMPSRDDSGITFTIKMQERRHFEAITESASHDGKIRKFSLERKSEYVVGEKNRAHSSYMNWIFKMIQKIGQHVEAATMTGDPWINSVVSVTCRDGSKQVWNTKMKINRSKFGHPFHQFPSLRKE